MAEFQDLLTAAKRFLDSLDELADVIEAYGETPLKQALEKMFNCRYAVSTAVEEIEEEDDGV